MLKCRVYTTRESRRPDNKEYIQITYEIPSKNGKVTLTGDQMAELLEIGTDQRKALRRKDSQAKSIDSTVKIYKDRLPSGSYPAACCDNFKNIVIR